MGGVGTLVIMNREREEDELILAPIMPPRREVVMLPTRVTRGEDYRFLARVLGGEDRWHNVSTELDMSFEDYDDLRSKLLPVVSQAMRPAMRRKGEEAMFLTMYRLRHGEDLEDMCRRFEIPTASGFDMIDQFTDAMLKTVVVRDLNRGLEEIWHQLPRFDGFPDYARLALDGTTFQTRREGACYTIDVIPGMDGAPDEEITVRHDMQRLDFDDKKKFTDVKAQFLCDRYGKIRHFAISDGPMNDSKLYDLAGTAAWMQVPGVPIVKALADAAYGKKGRDELLVPFKHYQTRLTPLQHIWNKKIGVARAIIERTNGRLKSWLRFFRGGVILTERSRLQKFLKCAVWLTNWHIDRHPMVARDGQAPV
jgi:hypothetical protein